jgi:hypothetical protein
MEAWAWLFAYVLGFGLLQLFLYRYFQREYGKADATPVGVEGTPAATTETARDVDGDGVRCSHCGTVNGQEPTIRYCRECTSPLN